ncbi:DUF2934 domain-containing protein [Allochromatium vinosum]|uniref:DUF2934 domain-containing protein n=1 Tax=Allochromatium vinosum (strain ATCC 17899 / DSM 180 / NBRC 103801 / NCIMB 10441 / D) TaxID=572477 RepID=D3RTL0_ALLVD|nr:DUF2934 domain-containing protein [Allochromatium vinosum]ADC62519.1 hypothetical protein Alvin_1586 [Allochromatium vinosum DSM 180]
MSECADRPTDSQRHTMIAVAAYYLAERRGFAPGQAEADWRLAEQAIDAMIASRCLTGRTDDETRARLIRNALVLQETAGGRAVPTTFDTPSETVQP